MFRAASLLALVACVAAQAGPSISIPAALTQCQPAQIIFTATRTPVAIPGGQAGAAPLQDLGQQMASPFTWTVNIPAGTSINLRIRDSSGAIAYSAAATIQDSADASCLGVQPSTTTTDGGSPAGTGVYPSVSPISSTSPGFTPTNTAAPHAKVGFAGLLGLAAAVVMA